MTDQELREMMLNYVGDNVGQSCECEACESQREVVMRAIQSRERQAQLAILDQVRESVEEEIYIFRHLCPPHACPASNIVGKVIISIDTLKTGIESK